MFWYTVHATTVVLVFIWGEGGGGVGWYCHLWPVIGMCMCMCLGLKQGIVLQETDQLVENYSLY